MPNALVSDPPLKQVVTRTLEAGFRSIPESKLRWSAGWFRAENSNDLLFVASQQTGFGYFTNFGKTQRQGAEFSLSGRIPALHFGRQLHVSQRYLSERCKWWWRKQQRQRRGTRTRREYHDAARRSYPAHSRNFLKTYVDYEATSKFVFDLDFIAAGRSFARGNENNQDKPDGVYYLGRVFSRLWRGEFGRALSSAKKLQSFAQIDNLLDHRYYTAAQLGPSPFDNAGNFIARPFPSVDGDFPIRTTTFFAPGSPIGVWEEFGSGSE